MTTNMFHCLRLPCPAAEFLVPPLHLSCCDLREFAEETLGMFGGVSVCPAAVERSAQIMSERLRAGRHECTQGPVVMKLRASLRT